MDHPRGGHSTGSTDANIQQFIKSTPHVSLGGRGGGELDDEHPIAFPPPVTEGAAHLRDPDSSTASTDPREAELYQSKLKYRPNDDFVGDDLVVAAPALIPNTFNHKHHPNAKTKEIGHKTAEAPQAGTQLGSPARRNSPVRAQTPPPATEPTDAPLYPPELNERWETTTSQPPTMNFSFGAGATATMIHNLGVQETPAWKRVNENFKEHQHGKIKSIFADKSRDADPDEHDLADDMLMLSTMTSDNERPLNPAPTSFKFPVQAPLSPLKLYREYDTYTREKLNKVCQDFQSSRPVLAGVAVLANVAMPASLVAPEASLAAMASLAAPAALALASVAPAAASLAPAAPAAASLAPSALAMAPAPAVVVSKADEYKQRGDSIYSKIKGQGFKDRHEVHASISTLMTTATLTPKVSKIGGGVATDDDESLQYTLGYDDDEFDMQHPGGHTMDMVNNMSVSKHDDEYTEYEPDSGLQRITEEGSEYTEDDYDTGDVTDLEIPDEPADDHLALASEVSDASKQHLRQRVQDLETMISEIKPAQLAEQIEGLVAENARLKDAVAERSRVSSGTNIDDTMALEITPAKYRSIDQMIKFKRASQLRLRPLNDNNGRSELDLSRALKVDRGHIRPDSNYPLVSGEMVFDSHLGHWVRALDQETVLDGFDDLLTDTESTAISKPLAMKKPRARSHREVLFANFPDDDDNDAVRSVYGGEVTQVSQLQDVLFTQSMKRLIAVVTDVLAASDVDEWQAVDAINLRGCLLDNVKDLARILPRLRSVNLLKNHLKYLDGLNPGVAELDVLENDIDNLTSFAQFQKLTKLVLARNSLVNLTGLVTNDALLVVKVLNNRISSLKGLEGLHNLVELDCSHNKLAGSLDLSKFSLLNLSKLNLLHNKLTTVTAIDSAPALTCLNLNDNSLTHITCHTKHINLKKLELKFNDIRRLNLQLYPYLRVLRIDGNNLGVCDFHRLKVMEELLIKSQPNPNIITLVVQGARDVRTLDVSGNHGFDLTMYCRNLFTQVQPNSFKNLNRLVLSAMNLTKIPREFAFMFPNVRVLNLNFNRLHDISGLLKLQNLRKVFLVSNDLRKINLVTQGLAGARDTLQVVDVRLNPCTVDIYPYVFSPDEIARGARSTMIPLQLADDIDTFVIHYDSVNREGDADWAQRDAEFVTKLNKQMRRHNYELYMIAYFWQLHKMDGNKVSRERRAAYLEEFLRIEKEIA